MSFGALVLNSVRDSWRRFHMPKRISMRDTRAAFAEIMGDESMQGRILRTGPILQMMDILGGSVAHKVARGPAATISFDRLDFIKPIYHRDLVRLEAQAVGTSRSSMAIHCCGYRYDMATKTYEQTLSAIMTFVAIDRFGRACPGLPALTDGENYERCQHMRRTAKQRRELSRRWRQEQIEVDKMAFVSSDMIKKPEDEKKSLVPFHDTSVELCHRFLPKHLNVNNTIFGGDLLTMMDEAALYCAQKFTGNQHMATIAMNRIFFKLPILVSDIVTLRARVCNVRRHVLEVEVEIFICPVFGAEQKQSHSGFFTVLNFDDNDNPKPIEKGLLVDESDQETMKALLKAHRRWEFEEEEKNLITMPPLDVSLVEGKLISRTL